MTLKTPEEWWDSYWKHSDQKSVHAMILAVRVEALRYAAELCISKEFSTAYVASEVIKAEADKLTLCKHHPNP